MNKGAEPPIHIDCEPPIAPVGRAFTVTTALPLKSPPFAEQLASLNVEIVNVVFDVGLTDTEIGLDEPLNEAPFERVPFHGPVPVTTIDRDGESPLQIVVVPLIVPVGREFTVITALPVRSPPTAAQFASLNVAIVYVVVEDGLTETLIGLLDPLNAAPFESVPLQGPVPVKLIESEVELPLQMDVVPLITPVGRALITTEIVSVSTQL